MPRRTEDSMKRLTGLAIALLVLMLGVAPSWSGPPNPTASDVNGNTAGGTNALVNVTAGGGVNTAFGSLALTSNTTGNFNTATGAQALAGNTTPGAHALLNNSGGGKNTALGFEALLNSTGNQNIAVGNEAGSALV